VHVAFVALYQSASHRPVTASIMANRPTLRLMCRFWCGKVQKTNAAQLNMAFSYLNPFSTPRPVTAVPEPAKRFNDDVI
jgi:hypothetical protein